MFFVIFVIVVRNCALVLYLSFATYVVVVVGVVGICVVCLFVCACVEASNNRLILTAVSNLAALQWILVFRSAKVICNQHAVAISFLHHYCFLLYYVEITLLEGTLAM